MSNTIRGLKQEIKPGLYTVSRETDEKRRTVLALVNETEDVQYNVCYTFPGNATHTVEALGRTSVADGGNKFAVSIYPTETLEFIQGSWKSFRRSLSYGAPDSAWQAKQQALRDQRIEEDIEAMRELVRAHPRCDGKYTAEYMAELCIAHNQRFVDLTFPPTSKSLARDWESSIGEFGWGRPESWCTPEEPPSLFVGAVEPNDIDQGVLGDCYFLCSVACVAEFPTLVRDIYSLPQNPELGLYRILVCKNGWWQSVLVDDYLPTRRGKPCFARNREEPNELWVALLEKAYAKLHGSYSAIRTGDAALAIADLLGAPFRKIQSMPQWSDKSEMFRVLKAADEADYLMVLGTPGVDGATDALAERYQAVGLTTGHAYSLLRVKEPRGQLKLCMIRNPWGDEKEWNGDWSDDSPLWTPELMREVDFYRGDDGTFWMEWSSVMEYFDNGSISRPLRESTQVRVAGNFVDGKSDVMVLVHVEQKTEVHFGYHQRDRRGLPTGDPDREYAGVLLSVVHDKSRTEHVILAETNGGAYLTSRDGYCDAILDPSPTPYMVLVQAYKATLSKSFTTSVYLRDPGSIRAIDFVSATNHAVKRYSPANRCVLADWSAKAVAKYQLRRVRADGGGVEFETLQGDSVDLTRATASAAARDPAPTTCSSSTPELKGRLRIPEPVRAMPSRATDDTPASAQQPPRQEPVVPPTSPGTPKTVPSSPAASLSRGQLKPESHRDPMVTPGTKSQPKVAAPAPAARPPPTNASKPRVPGVIRGGGAKLQVIALSGRNLAAKDSNGLSDPYVTVKLKTRQGDRLSQDQRVESRYLKETLNPVWAEVFNFTVSGEEILCVKCWDKDLIGHDLMGTLNIPVAQVLAKLAPGGPAVIEWLRLSAPPQDVSGDLQFAFCWKL